jgi:phosphatidylglycerol:prolipoprotein diacylglycerol transferase
LFSAGVLIGARCVEVLFYEWAHYREHPGQIPAIWLGGMSTHGILLGAIAGVWIFCRWHGRHFLEIADALAIPGAFLMGIGRLGNFIDGQILGSVTDVWWAVKFPDAEGFRHPVVLYDGLKNLLLIPLLLLLRSRRPPRGVVLAHFVLWYGLLRIPIDLFREYPGTLMGLATGQSFNVFMTVLGAALLWRFRRGTRAPEHEGIATARLDDARGLWPRRLAFAALLIVSLTMPSDWTQDVPVRYGKRHAGMRHSWLYPSIGSDEQKVASVP